MGMKFNPLTGQMNMLPNSGDIRTARGALFRDPRTSLYPVSCRNGVLYAATSGTSKYAMSIRSFYVNGCVPVKSVRVRLPNWYISTSTAGEVATGNRIKINMSIESPRGSTPRPFYVNGSRDIYVESGQTVEAADRTGLVINAGASFYLHMYVTAVDAAGAQLTTGKLPTGRATTIFGGNAERLALDGAASDQTLVIGGETTIAGSPANLYHPFLVAGEPLYPGSSFVPAVIGGGDSIMVGRTEVDNFGADGNGNSGWAERWLGNTAYGIGFINCGVSGTKASQWKALATAGSYNRLLQALDGVGTHFLCVMGVNDAASDSGTTILSNTMTITNFMKSSLGLRTVLGTLTPISGSTNLWADLAGQSAVTPNSANRAAYNTLVRSGAYDASVQGFIDGGAIMEQGSTGFWISNGSANGYCGDSSGSGVHMTGAGHLALATGLPNPTTVFTF